MKENNKNKAVENFLQAWQKFEEFLNEPIVNERDKAGIIQAYEFTIETAWKALKKIGENEGAITNTPREAISFAFSSKILEDQNQQIWLDMLYARNLTSHIYNSDLSDQIINSINASYREELKKLALKIRSIQKKA